jgi:hypothetical protein
MNAHPVLCSQTKKIDETPGMIEDLLRGLTVQRQGVVDTSFVDDLRNYMFSTPTWNQVRVFPPSPAAGW